MKTHRNAGQVNLRGKKFHSLSCMCCEVRDHREELNEDFDLRLAAREVVERKDDDPRYRS